MPVTETQRLTLAAMPPTFVVTPELWRNVLDSLEAAVCAVDGELQVTLANRVWDSLAHSFDRPELRAGRLVGRSFLEVLDPADRDRWAAICARLLDGEEASYWGEISWPVNGTRRWMMLTACTLLGPEHEPIGISFTLADSTERRRSEEEKAQRQIELRGLFEVAQTVSLDSGGSALIRRVTGHLGYLLRARICAIALYEPESDRLTVQIPAQGLTQDEAVSFLPPQRLLLETNEPTVETVGRSYLLHRDVRAVDAASRTFSEYWNLTSLLTAPLRHQGRLLGYLILADAANGFTEEDGRLLATFAVLIAAAIDTSRLVLTLRDRADKLSAALAEIQELDRLKDEMIQNVSHELRLPLMVIQGYVDLIHTGGFGELAPDLKQAVAVVNQKVQQLTHRVDDITLLRGSGAIELQRDLTPLARLAQSAIERLQPQAAENHVTITTEIGSEGTLVFGDSRRLSQVINELLENAIKFSPNGGQVQVTVRAGGEVVYLKVADQGIGIQPGEINRIWNRFYQADGSTTRRFSGTGVGLAVVKEIVEAHGGQAWAESQPGEGSQFYVALRRALGNEQESEQQDAAL